MEDAEFDRAFVTSAFRLIAEKGWRRLSLVEAGRNASLPIDRVRLRFPNRTTLLLRFGEIADEAALNHAGTDGSVRDQLFDMLMRRIDVLQSHRDGVIALLAAAPADPAAVLLLSCAGLVSMGWFLDAAGVGQQSGFTGLLRCKGLMAVWLWTVNAWRRDTSEDLSATMAALDSALTRAESASIWLRGGHAPNGSDRRPDASGLALPAPV